MKLPLAAALVAAAAVAVPSLAQSTRSHNTKAKSASSKRGPRGPRGPRGYQGQQGPQGTPGAQGPAGNPASISYTTVSQKGTVPNGQISTFDATCPAGYYVSGGGVGVGANDLVYATSLDEHTYEVALANFTDSIQNANGSAQAFCISGAITATRAVPHVLSAADRTTLIKQYEAKHG